MEPVASSPFKTLVVPDSGSIEDGSPSGFNFNRILKQIRAGSEAISGEYLLVMRSDLELTSLRFVRRQKKAVGEGALLRERLVTTSVYFKTRYFSKGFRRSIPASFHPSDWIWFGLKDDVERMYRNLDAIPRESVTVGICPSKKFNPYENLYTFRFPSEMYFGLNIAEEIKRHCFLDYDVDDRVKWLQFCSENFVILPARKFSFKKNSAGHQKAVKFPFFEPSILFGTTTSRRLFFRKILSKVINL
jgi:hypothetical protein